MVITVVTVGYAMVVMMILTLSLCVHVFLALRLRLMWEMKSCSPVAVRTPWLKLPRGVGCVGE